MTEEEIAGIFDRVAQDLDDPGIAAVVRRAERDAGRVRRRHRAYAAAGSVLAVGALAAAGAAITILPRSSTAPGAPAADRHGGQAAAHPGGAPAPATSAHKPVPSPSPTASSTPTPSPSTSSGTNSEIMSELRALLPANSTISDVRSQDSRSVEFDYNDGQGAVDFMFSIEPTSFYANQLTCSASPWNGVPDEGPRPAGALPQSCTMTTLPDGSIERDWVEYADAYGFYGYNVTDQRPDGTVVYAQVGNGINHTVPQVDRAVPPGSFAEWNALVQNPAWHL